MGRRVGVGMCREGRGLGRDGRECHVAIFCTHIPTLTPALTAIPAYKGEYEKVEKTKVILAVRMAVS